MRLIFYLFSLAVFGTALYLFFNGSETAAYWTAGLYAPFFAVGLHDVWQKKHAILRNYPVLGHGRYLMEALRPKVYQYFIESDTDGEPINRIHRAVVYQRSKKDRDTSPFGTQLDIYGEGYEWMNHSIGAKDLHELDTDPRVRIGGPDCKQPYDCSIFNISAMSYGSLGSAAISALNGGAYIGRFAHNTGEGGVSPHHKKFGGDLIYQVGTGYFGCRTEDGKFHSEKFRELSALPQIKMIELKLSQGAKPGHGGILPAKKNTQEIADIRGIEPGTAVLSPPAHSAFDSPVGLLQFIQQMRDLSEGKPIGFKLCIGHKSEFLSICQAMLDTGITPDFISVDGGEGGTGAAPLEFSDRVGMPYREALAFVHDVLRGYNLREKITIIASGKILTGFDVFRAFALGAEVCYSARGMMLALGCIQSLRCNQNDCPVGVATVDDARQRGLVVSDKKKRVANYHHETIESFLELVAAAGLESPAQIKRHMVYRRTSLNKIRRYSEIYPSYSRGCLLNPETVPEAMQPEMQYVRTDGF